MEPLKGSLLEWYNHQYIHKGMDDYSNAWYVKLVELQYETERLKKENEELKLANNKE